MDRQVSGQALESDGRLVAHHRGSSPGGGSVSLTPEQILELVPPKTTLAEWRKVENLDHPIFDDPEALDAAEALERERSRIKVPSFGKTEPKLSFPSPKRGSR